MRLWKRTRDQMGGEARQVLDAEPPQDDAMGVVLNAWGDLSTCRPVGFSEGRIPWTAADRWCERHGLDMDESRLLWAVIKRLDIDELDRRAFEPNRPKPPVPRR